MRRTTFLFFLVALCLLSIRLHAESDYVEKIIKIEHPRILLLKGDEKAIQQAIAQNTTWAKMHQAILNAADAMIDKPVVERKLEGVRLLDVSREALRRIFFLSYAYRVSGNEKYAQRAEKEM